MPKSPPIIDAEFTVIAPGETCAPVEVGGAHPLTQTVCYWIVGIAFTALAIWARPHVMHLIGRAVFGDR